MTVADWHTQAACLDVPCGILVQAAPTEAETAFLLQQADQHSSVLGVVGWADWLAPEAPERIRALAQHPKLKGLRPMLQDIADPAWILQPAVQPALRAMADCGLVFDALVKPVHLPHILTLAKHHPELTIVIDHGAKPDIAAGEWQAWATALEPLAQQAKLVCKVSGLLTEAGPHPAPNAAQAWMDHLLLRFGAHRLLWGSDWPVLELSGASYRDWHATCRAWTAGWTAPEQAGFWGGNARRIYQLQ